MPTITRSALVPYRPAQMFRLVNDVEQYPEFLAWCTGARVLERSAAEMVAEIRVRLGGIEQRFATRNTLSEPDSIAMALVSGPFRELGGEWSFQRLGPGSKVELRLEFELRSRLLHGPFSNGFARVAERLVADFCTRADDVYGAR